MPSNKSNTPNNLTGIDEEQNEFQSLVEAMRSISHPQLSPARAKIQLSKILSYWDDDKTSVLNKWDDQISKFLSSLWVKRLAPVFVILVVFLLGTLILSSTNPSMAKAGESTGIVMVSSGDQDWILLKTGERVGEGSWIRTYADSSLSLEFEDGSRMFIGPGSEVHFLQLETRANGLIQLELEQETGRTVNRVVPFNNPRSFYRIETIAGVANVHGTVFDVQVNEGTMRVSVEAGEVQLENETDDQLIESGQTATSEEGEVIAEPEYEFVLQGEVTELGASEWVVAGVYFNVNTDTVILGSPEVGSLGSVRGRIFTDGSRIADIIELTLRDREKAAFSGLVEVINADNWIIGGQLVLVDSETEIKADLAVGMPVKVHFIVFEDGTWLAKEIEAFEDREDDEQEEEPGEEIKGVCSHEKQHPVGLKLAEKYGVSYEEIMGWFCQNFGFGEIDLAYEMSLQSGISVEELFAMKADGTGWGNIRKTVITKTPRPTREPKVTKEPKPTRTPRPTKEPKPTREPKPTKVPKPTRIPKIKP